MTRSGNDFNGQYVEKRRTDTIAHLSYHYCSSDMVHSSVNSFYKEEKDDLLQDMVVFIKRKSVGVRGCSTFLFRKNFHAN